jgi:hypothetical protein
MRENEGTSPVELYEKILDRIAAPHSSLFACQLAHFHIEESRNSQPWQHHVCGLPTHQAILQNTSSQPKVQIYENSKVHIIPSYYGVDLQIIYKHKKQQYHTEASALQHKVCFVFGRKPSRLFLSRSFLII